MKKHIILAGMTFAVVAVCCASNVFADDNHSGELLYNGIRLPEQWPPQIEKLDGQPMRVPYLQSPPKVIPIDVGRQLFVDDFLVETTTLRRTWHRPEFYEGNPILKPEKPWEKTGRGPMALPHSGGVCFDPTDRLFKLWYITGYQQGVGLVYSKDGLHWKRPTFDHIEAGTNMVSDSGSRGSTIWMDLQTKDPKKRFVQFSSRPGCVWFSEEGIHWGKQIKIAGPMYDRTTLFWNPFRKVWVYSIKGTDQKLGRVRRYWETPKLVGHKKSTWQKREDPTFWTSADSADPPHKHFRIPCQLYDLDCVAYESLLLGSFIIWRGDYRKDSKTEEAHRLNRLGRPKQNSACMGYSRDGFHWHRPDRRPFLPKSDTPGDWNWGNSQTACMSPLVVGDKLYFYVAGRGGLKYPGNTYQDAGGSTGVAFLRRDGFASMDTDGKPGELTTRPVRFNGKHPFVNADTKGGSLTVEILDYDNRVIEPFTRSNCIPVRGDSTLAAVRWKGAEDLSALQDKPVRFRFHLDKGSLYSFWVSPSTNGASHGYVAGGGPGFDGPTDTVGKQGYEKSKQLNSGNGDSSSQGNAAKTMVHFVSETKKTTKPDKPVPKKSDEMDLEEKSIFPTKSMKFGKRRFCYVDEGKGDRVLLLIRGTRFCEKKWDKQIPAFVKAGYRVISPYRAGTGGSDYVDFVSATTLAQDMYSLLDCLDIRKFVVVGHCGGARVAWQMYLMRPFAIEAFINFDSGLFGKLKPRKPYVERMDPETRVMYERNKETLAKVDRLWDYPSDYNTKRMLRNQAWGKKYAKHCSRTSRQPDERNLEPRRPYYCHVPVLSITCGRGRIRQDDPEAVKMEEKYRKTAKSFKFVVITNSGHYPNQEQPELFNKTILDFLATLPPKK
ncbi:MAG: alpha/beta hydrolase [Pirellulales bacterium]|nr:alpha/beta hydrolase [Pirellulales bacterium]